MGARLRRLRDGPGPRDAAADARGTRRRRCAWPTCAGAPRHARRGVAAPDPARAARAAGASAAWRRSPAPSSSSSSSRTPTRRRSRRAIAASSRPTSTTSTTRCSARARVEPLMAGSAARWPPRAWWSRAPRASATTASTRSTSATGRRCGPPTSTSIYKTGAKEIAALEGMSITFMAKYDAARGLVVPHPPLARRDGSPDSHATRRFRALRRRPARLPARADAVLRAERQLLQALRERLVRPHRGRLGPRQPHVRGAGRRPRRLRCGSSCACRAPTSTRTWRWRR